MSITIPQIDIYTKEKRSFIYFSNQSHCDIFLHKLGLQEFFAALIGFKCVRSKSRQIFSSSFYLESVSNTQTNDPNANECS